ncbi:MAG: HU family DNA-binding protein [Actinomycetia bacterium]|nr:HU family DNA-binding protein [Actinomycetes bacterium]
MNKAQLIDEVAGQFDGNRRAAQNALEAVIGTITRQVAKGEPVAITGFGKFERRIRPAGTARNPQTGATVKTKRKSVPKFTPGAEFKAVVNGEKKLAAPAKKAAAKKTTKKAAAKKTTKKAPARKAPAKRAPARKAAAKKAPVRKAAAKKTARKR